jgi:hypothetical protein
VNSRYARLNVQCVGSVTATSHGGRSGVPARRDRVVPRTRPNEFRRARGVAAAPTFVGELHTRSPLGLGRLGLGLWVGVLFRRAPVTVSDPGEDGWLTVDLLEPFVGLRLTNRNRSRAAAAFRAR